ncbi:uncharacterized protein isoform X2 [Rhodnius prolixus]|uniref:uncharacterized protein isoform X2 n=1 Tax=Rhodnius prolixus TaxID=13249 RepID=UPI003D189883
MKRLVMMKDAPHRSQTSVSMATSPKYIKETQDRINCAQEVINSDCANEKGKSNFDSWLEGLNIVQHYLCESSFNSMRALWQTTRHGLPCWRLEKYLTCVENTTKITHVLDMLQVRMDVNECNYILIAMSSCATTHSLPDQECEITRNELNEILHLFIQRSKCSCRFSNSSRNLAFNSKTMFFWLMLLVDYLNLLI